MGHSRRRTRRCGRVPPACRTTGQVRACCKATCIATLLGRLLHVSSESLFDVKVAECCGMRLNLVCKGASFCTHLHHATCLQTGDAMPRLFCRACQACVWRRHPCMHTTSCVKCSVRAAYLHFDVSNVFEEFCTCRAPCAQADALLHKSDCSAHTP